MQKIPSRIFLILCLFVLISLACKAPILSQFQPDAGTSEDTPMSSGDDVPDPSDSDFDTPHNTDGAELTYIPGATFQMGSVSADDLADEDEFPLHEVNLEEFYIYTYEVTNQMYGACIDAGYCLSPFIMEDGPTSHFEDSDYQEYPVVGVDWVMSRDYCAWAGSRLPTEAEWELSSRGSDSLLYPWGEEEPTCDHVNMVGCKVPPDTEEVGYYLMGNSPEEVWDMSGNVWEWVHDWYAEDYYAQSPADNPIGPLEPEDPDKPLRVIRGGGLNSTPDKMRSATRMGLNPYRTFTDVGFRCVAGEGLSLPAAYDHGRDRHERVPPDSADGGDSADDPDGDDSPYAWAEDTVGPCPDGSGGLEISIHGGSTPPPDNVYATAGGDIWDGACDYDEVTETIICRGPEPHDYLDPGPPLPLNVCFWHISWTDCVLIFVHKPIDCDERARRYEIETECIELDGSLTPVITFAFWSTTGEDFEFATADGVPLTCEYDFGLEKYICSGLPGTFPSDLEFVAGFTDLTGWSTIVPFPDCEETLDFTPPWELVVGTCTIPPGHPAQYDLFIDTHVEGLADADWIGWSLDGVVPPQNCAPAQPPEGRWNCSFAVSDYTGVSLEFCARWPDNPAGQCATFPDLVDYLPPHDSPECSPPEDHGDEPGSGFCIVETPGSCGSNPCRPECEASGPNESCIPCTMP